MVQLTPGHDDKVVAFQVGGKVTPQEINTLTNAIAARIAARGKVCLYCEVEDDIEYNADASLADFGYNSSHLQHFSRVAVVSSKDWLSILSHITDSIEDTELKHFMPTHKEQATAWVTAK